MKKTKILFIINNLNMGGAETFLALLLKHLSKYPDIEPVLVSMTGEGTLDGDVKNLGIKHKIFHYHLFRRYIHRYDPFIRLKLLWFVFREKPDIIHAHLLGSDLAAKFLGGIFKIPVIVTHHDTIITHPGQKHFFANRYLTKAIAVSNVVADYLNRTFRIAKEKVIVIPDAIETEKFEGGKKDFDLAKPVFMFIGRLIPLKGIHFAIEALAKLAKEYPGLIFKIVGDDPVGSYIKELRTLIEKNNWNFVEFQGKTRDVVGALRQADFFILPSETEGFSIAVLEACAAFKPVIATPTGAIPEMVKDGESGYLVKHGDVEGIYGAARKLLQENNVLAFGIKANAIARESFSIEKVAEMHYNLYLDIANENKQLQ